MSDAGHSQNAHEQVVLPFFKNKAARWRFAHPRRGRVSAEVFGRAVQRLRLGLWGVGVPPQGHPQVVGGVPRLLCFRRLGLGDEACVVRDSSPPGTRTTTRSSFARASATSTRGTRWSRGRARQMATFLSASSSWPGGFVRGDVSQLRAAVVRRESPPPAYVDDAPADPEVEHETAHACGCPECHCSFGSFMVLALHRRTTPCSQDVAHVRLHQAVPLSADAPSPRGRWRCVMAFGHSWRVSARWISVLHLLCQRGLHHLVSHVRV